MISARIEATNVEVPVIVGEDQEIRLGQPPPPQIEPCN